MIRLVVLGASGDAYLVCGLAGSVQEYYGTEVEVVLRQRLAPVAELFKVRYVIDDELVHAAETNGDMHANHVNRIGDGVTTYAHPCFRISPHRVDHLTTKSDASQADMYRIILGLPPNAKLALPHVPPMAQQPDTVLLITESTSWPNRQPNFWPYLAEGLLRTREVVWNDSSWDLAELFRRCAAAEWVIGPQCGVMSILVTGQFPCRKTLATPSLDGNLEPQYLASETYPYGYVTKFANHDYDVEEFKITDGNHAELRELIVNGANARRLWPHDPRPVMTIQAPLSPGDVLDRLAVLTVKRARFDPPRRAANEREYQRYAEIYRRMEAPPWMLRDLIELHEESFDLLEDLVPAALAPYGADVDGHIAVIRLNRRRAEMRRAINAACHGPYNDVKAYHDPAG
jgi:hypothetical protein